MTVSVLPDQVNGHTGESVTLIPNVPAADTSSGSTIAVDNPATDEVIGRVADSDAEQVQAAVSRARQAQAGWAKLGARSRAELFTRSRHWLLSHRQEVVDSIVAENGKAEEDAIVELPRASASTPGCSRSR
jgi:acyl-CoA reductase-like NAD-dependent aldehyde dehydrogenase